MYVSYMFYEEWETDFFSVCERKEIIVSMVIRCLLALFLYVNCLAAVGIWIFDSVEVIYYGGRGRGKKCLFPICAWC